MQMSGIPFGTTDWSQIARTEHKGERGLAYWRTQHFGKIRVRMVEYTPGYLADHWCVKGHILLCTAGELHTEAGHELSSRRQRRTASLLHRRWSKAVHRRLKRGLKLCHPLSARRSSQ